MTRRELPVAVEVSKEVKPSPSRRHDLDALRAAAMLLGVAYHAALSFSLGNGWIVSDVRQSKLLYVFQALVHGFRMQLFMILSRFFTAMLWRNQGLKALLWNRLRRVLLPFLVGMVSVVPAMRRATEFAKTERASVHQKPPEIGPSRLSTHPPSVLWHEHCASPLDENPTNIITLWSATTYVTLPPSLQELCHDNFGLPSVTASKALLRFPANTAASPSINQVLTSIATVENAATEFSHAPRERSFKAGPPYGSELQIQNGLNPSLQKDRIAPIAHGFRDICARLMQTPVFTVLWFLWFLTWFVLLFPVYALAAERFHWRIRPHALIASQLSLIWLVPLTVIPTWFMESSHGEFGPDTSMGILPIPHVLAYYGLFFGFGVLYYEAHHTSDRLGNSWRWTLTLCLLVVFPTALEFATGVLAVRNSVLSAFSHRIMSVFLQSLYAWMMAFGLMGMFRTVLSVDRCWIRYMSDASYWVYLVHLPLVVITQAMVCRWPFPAILKFLVVILVVGSAMLWTYHKFVRYSPIGAFLNGRRFPSLHW